MTPVYHQQGLCIYDYHILVLTDKDLAIYIPPDVAVNSTTPDGVFGGTFTSMTSPIFFSFAENQTSNIKVASTILGAFVEGVTLNGSIKVTLRLGDPVEY